MSFADLSPAVAEAYRARVAADGPARLYELAQRLTADGVALDEFDASIPSLKPLWRWYVDFARADFPGIPPDAQARKEIVDQQGPSVARASYASEMVVHYLFEVARRCFTGVEWVTNPNLKTGHYQRTAVRYIDDDDYHGLAHLDWAVAGATQMFLQGISSEHAEPDFLADAFLTGPFLCSLKTAERCRQLPRGSSILAPRLNAGRPEDDGPPAIGPQSKPTTPEPAENTGEGVGDELILANKKADVEALEKAPPIDVDLATITIAALGFRDVSGASPTRDTILAEEFAEFVREDDAALITTLVSGGKLRALQVAANSPSATAWAEITEQLTQLANQVRGRLAREDEF